MVKIHMIIIVYLTAVTYAAKRHHPEVYEDLHENLHRTEVLRRTRQSKIQQTYNPVTFDVRHARQQDQQKYRYLQQQTVDMKNHARNAKLPRPQSYSRQERIVPHLKELMKTLKEGEKPTEKTPFSKKMVPKVEKLAQNQAQDSTFSPSEEVLVHIQTADGWKVMNEPTVRPAITSKHTQVAFINNNGYNSQNEQKGKSLEDKLPPVHEMLSLSTLRPVKKVTIKEENVTKGETILTNVFESQKEGPLSSFEGANVAKNRLSYQVSENTDLEFDATEEHEVQLENIDRQDLQHPVIRLRVRKARKQATLGSDQKATASVHGFPLVAATPGNYIYISNTDKPQTFHQNINALSALIGKHPQQQLQGLQTLLGSVEQSQEHAHFQNLNQHQQNQVPVQYYTVKDHTPITEHVSDVVNTQSRPNVQIITQQQHQNQHQEADASQQGLHPTTLPQYVLYKPDVPVETTGHEIQKALFSSEAQKETEALIQSQANEFALKQAHVRQQLANVARAQEIANAKIKAINEQHHIKATSESSYHLKQRVKAVEGDKVPTDGESISVSIKSRGSKLRGEKKLLRGGGKNENRVKRDVSSSLDQGVANKTGDDVEYDLEYYEYDYDSDGNDTEIVYYDYLITLNGTKDSIRDNLRDQTDDDDDAQITDRPRFEKLVAPPDDYYDSYDSYPDVEITTEGFADRRYHKPKGKPKFHRHKPFRKRKRRPAHHPYRNTQHLYAPKPKPVNYETYSQVTPKPAFHSFPDLKPTYFVSPTFKPTYEVVSVVTEKAVHQKVHHLPNYHLDVKPSLPSYAQKKDKEPTNVIVINNSNDNHNHGGQLHHAQHEDHKAPQNQHSHHYHGHGGHGHGGWVAPVKKGVKSRRKRVKKRKRPVVVHHAPSTKHIIRITKKVNSAIHKLGHVAHVK